VRLGRSWLGHRRLSIVDVESGHQPLATPDEDLWLVGNGEIYNHEEVRAGMSPSRYSTRSDNEVALHLLAERGPRALGELEGLHNLNLQRCDRVTMAHGLEARVPFLDREVIAFALRLPAAAKLASPGQPEKRLLREAFAGWLPHELLWREKSQFGDGSGAASVLTAAIEATVGEAELERERDVLDPPLRTREELAYFRIFSEHLPGVRPERTVGRFATA
jgi:asparagine synthetase B (glutamine-hydrolysing)